jgi:predicted nucleic acid-binding protein
MSRWLLDTNVVLDVLLKRQPWVAEAQTLWTACDDGRAIGYVTASSLTDIFYIAHRQSDLSRARETVQLCLEAFEICPVDRSILEQALALKGPDFEDNVQMVCAAANSLDGIVTRDATGFKEATIPVVSVSEVLGRL